MSENDNTNGAVCLLSGGMDSSVLLHYVVKKLGRGPVFAVSFNYDQRHDRELECARYQAELLGIPLQVVDMRFIGPLVAAGTTLVKEGGDVPDFSDLADEDMAQPPTYVPNRNMMLLSIAAACAEARGVSAVFYGAQARDEYGYWDCTSDFLERLNAVFALNRKTPVLIHAPFVHTKKAELVELGEELGVNFKHTWSCYRGGQEACGACPTCVERIKAFQEAGVEDPLAYAPSKQA